MAKEFTGLSLRESAKRKYPFPETAHRLGKHYGVLHCHTLSSFDRFVIFCAGIRLRVDSSCNAEGEKANEN